MMLIRQGSDIQMGLNTWAQLRRTIPFVREQTESLRHIYLDLDSGISGIPGAITSEPQDTTNLPVLRLPGNVYPNSPNIIRALDEVLSELRTLEIKYMLEQDPSNIDGPALNIPFLLRLKFQVKGKRDLKTILAELGGRNEDMMAITKELREMAQWKFKTSARQMSNVEPGPTTGHVSPLEVEPSFPIASIESPALVAPPAGGTPLPVGWTTPPAGGTPLPAGGTPLPAGGTTPPVGDTPLPTPLPVGGTPPAHASIPPRAGETTAIDNPPRPPSSHARASVTSFRYGINTDGREFQSAESFASYERQDNYSTHTGDQICKQCHQVWRRD